MRANNMNSVFATLKVNVFATSRRFRLSRSRLIFNYFQVRSMSLLLILPSITHGLMVWGGCSKF